MQRPSEPNSVDGAMVAWADTPSGIAGIDDNASEVQLCVVCFERPSGAKLQPCGHDHFCQPCTRHFRTCPLCRVPLAMLPGGYPRLESTGEVARDLGTNASTSRNLGIEPVVSEGEGKFVLMVIFVAWLFIFFGGYIEFTFGIPAGCLPGDPVLMPADAAARGQEVINSTDVCVQCIEGRGCYKCKEGYVNFGLKCFKYIENFPAIEVGAVLGGTTYFILIIVTQVAGISSELFLIRRLIRRNLMPRKELIVLILALVIEVTRMLLVDVFMLMDYFSGRSYRIFRAPLLLSECGLAAGDARTWQGSDGLWYCSKFDLPSQDTGYYLASHQTAFTSDSGECSIFTSSSALLNFKESAPEIPNRGAPRFENLGWVLGGEFALYYFFATFVNELADNMFVVPTTTNIGWLCKIFSVALEVFQLGALCPAAIFTHNDCIHYTDPLGVSLHTISFIVVMFGYCCWGFLLFALPLACVGFAVYSCLCTFVVLCWFAASCMRHLASCCGSNLFLQFADCLSERAERLLAYAHEFNSWMSGSREKLISAVMVFAFVPLLLGGMFLGSLVIVGQSSKRGAMSVFTALVLLSDVLLKVGATAATEIADYALHVRVRRAVASGSGLQQRSTAQTIGLARAGEAIEDASGGQEVVPTIRENDVTGNGAADVSGGAEATEGVTIEDVPGGAEASEVPDCSRGNQRCEEVEL